MTISPRAAVAALDREIARRSLSEYAIRVSPSTYQQPPQVLAMLQALQEVEEKVEAGEQARLIIELPPRSSKTTHSSRIFPSWHLGRHPADGVILASYADTLATDNGRAVKDFIEGAKYPFPTKIRADVKAAGRWQTEDKGGLVAVGVGTSLTGWPFPGSLAIVDDPVKGRMEAESDIVRDNTWTWWQTTLLTRMSECSALVLQGTRWHESDLIGRVLNSPGGKDWTRLRIPYFAEPDDPLGRPEGEPLKTFGSPPQVEKGEISSYDFAALYQQRPSPAGGGVFKADWMQRRYSPSDLERVRKQSRWLVIQTVDLGGKQGVGHDPSAIATWGSDGISFYLLDYWSSQAEYADIKPKFAAKFAEWKPRMMYVEDATWAQPLISDLRRQSGIRVAAIPVRGSKWVRADSVAPEFEANRVVLPQQAPWLDAWIREHTSFPNGTHDEAVDTTSAAIMQFTRAQSMPGRTTLATKDTRSTDPTERIRKKFKERIRA